MDDLPIFLTSASLRKTRNKDPYRVIVNNEMHDEDEFNAILLSALDDALLALGEIVRKTIYECLETRNQVRRDQMLEKLQAFQQGLHELLGEGAVVIEKQAMKNLYHRLRLDFVEHNNWTLVEYVHDAKKRVTHTSRRSK